MLIKIERQDAFNRYPKFPWHNFETDEYYLPSDFKHGILTLPSNSMQEHISMLSSSLIKLVKAFHADNLIFLGETETPWQHQDNEYRPVRAALAYLKNNNVSRQFNGALEVHVEEMDEFIGHLLWLTSSNALPVVHFMDKGQSMLGTICKYGNVHFSLLKEDVRDDLFEEGDFKFSPYVNCSWPFKLEAV